MGTHKPSPRPRTDAEKIIDNFGKGANKAACKVLDELGFGRACGKGGKITSGPADTAEIEEQLERELNIHDGETVNFINQLSKTLVTVEKHGIASVRGRDEDTSCAYTIVVPGGGSLKYGAPFSLKSSCNGRFLAKTDAHGNLRASQLASGTKFYLYNVQKVGDRSEVRDFAIVGIKASDGKWLGASKDGSLRVNRRTIGDGAVVHFSIYGVTEEQRRGPHCS